MPSEGEDGSGESASQWKPLLIPFRGLMQTGNFSKEEQLLRERKRMGTFGITTYDCDVESGRFLFPASGSLFTCVDPDLIVSRNTGHEYIYYPHFERKVSILRLGLHNL